MRVVFVSDNWDESEGFSMDFMALSAIEDFNGIEDMTVYPNPATDVLNIDLTLFQADKLNLRLVDMTGKLLKEEVVEGADGDNHLRFDINGVAKGLYLLEVATPSGKSVRKVTVQ
jgi:hypothetical protein